MKIKTVIISLLIVALMITSFLCVNANASSDTFDLPHTEHGVIDYTDALSKGHFVFNYHKNYWVINPEYFAENYFEYFVIYNTNNSGSHCYTLCFLGTSEDPSLNGQIQLYNNCYYFQNMLCLNFSGLDSLTQFFNDPANNLDLVRKFYTSATFPVQAPCAASLDKIVYSSSDYVITQTYLNNGTSETGYKTQTMEESKWVYLNANPLPYNGIIPEEEEDDDKGILETLKEILKTIKDYFKFNTGMLIFDHAGELINEKLANNKFYTSLTSIKRTLTELYNEDYSSRTGFYDLGLTNITLGRTQTYKYVDVGNEVIGNWEQKFLYKTGPIDYGLENVKVLNLDWYFGEDLGNGYYTKGMKPYIDNFISAFLWLAFAWGMYLNLPNWISGEMTQIGNILSSGSGLRVSGDFNDNRSEKVFTTRKVDNLTGEILSDTTTTIKKGK